jgi:hypothetical protein
MPLLQRPGLDSNTPPAGSNESLSRKQVRSTRYRALYTRWWLDQGEKNHPRVTASRKKQSIGKSQARIKRAAGNGTHERNQQLGRATRVRKIDLEKLTSSCMARARFERTSPTDSNSFDDMMQVRTILLQRTSSIPCIESGPGVSEVAFRCTAGDTINIFDMTERYKLFPKNGFAGSDVESDNLDNKADLHGLAHLPGNRDSHDSQDIKRIIIGVMARARFE